MTKNKRVGQIKIFVKFANFKQVEGESLIDFKTRFTVEYATYNRYWPDSGFTPKLLANFLVNKLNPNYAPLA